MEFKFLKYTECASSEDHFYEVLLKYVGWFQRRRLITLTRLNIDSGLFMLTPVINYLRNNKVPLKIFDLSQELQTRDTGNC